MVFNPVDKIIGKGNKSEGLLKDQINFKKKLLSEEFKKEKEEKNEEED